MSKSTETADAWKAAKQKAFDDAEAARRWTIRHPLDLIPRPARRKAHGRGWNGGGTHSQMVRPARPSGVALASPNSRLGKAQRA